MTSTFEPDEVDERIEDSRQGDSLLRRLDRNFRWLLVVVAFLLVGGIGQYVAFQNEQVRQDDAAKAQCRRVQQLRDLVNHNDGLIHRDLELTASVLIQPSLMRRLSETDRTERLTDSTTLTQLATSMFYEAQTNCDEAVAHPDSYVPPYPVAYGN